MGTCTQTLLAMCDYSSIAHYSELYTSALQSEVMSSGHSSQPQAEEL